MGFRVSGRGGGGVLGVSVGGVSRCAIWGRGRLGVWFSSFGHYIGFCVRGLGAWSFGLLFWGFGVPGFGVCVLCGFRAVGFGVRGWKGFVASWVGNFGLRNFRDFGLQCRKSRGAGLGVYGVSRMEELHTS